MKTTDVSLSDSVESYFYDVSRYRHKLSREEEYNLIKKIRNGDEAARNEFINCNLRFVISTAKKYRGFGVPFADLISEGNCGLIKAVECFDETKGTKFITYAVWWIKHSIKECIKRFNADENVFSLDDNNVNDENIKNDAFNIYNESETSAKDNNDTRKQEIEMLLSALDDRERYMVTMNFGLDGNEPMTYKEISTSLGNITPERVRQILSNSMDKLKIAALKSDDNNLFL